MALYHKGRQMALYHKGRQMADELTVKVNVRLTPALKAKLERIADSQHRTLSNLVQMALQQYAEEVEKTKRR